MKQLFRLSAAGLLALFLTACVHTTEKKVVAEDKPTAAEEPAKTEVDPNSIYARLGGQASIDAAVDIFYKKVLADDKVNHFFEDVNMQKQHNKQKAFLGAALGGPEPWTGKDMRAAHKHLDLKEEDFGAIAGHLVATLKELKVDQALIDEIVAVLMTTKDDVLNKPAS